MSKPIETPDEAFDPARDKNLVITRSLLGYGVLAGAVYVVGWLAQAFTRDGFDPTTHAASLLSNGDLGWIQVANFVVSGLMTVAAAVGLSRCLTSGVGSRWAPTLVGGYGVSLICAGAFRADPAEGFPAGTPDGPGDISWHGMLHVIAGGIGFLAMIVAIALFARRFAHAGLHRWAYFSGATSVLFFAAFAGIASGSTSPAVVVPFSVAVVLVWIWLAAVTSRFYRRLGVGLEA